MANAFAGGANGNNQILKVFVRIALLTDVHHVLSTRLKSAINVLIQWQILWMESAHVLLDLP